MSRKDELNWSTDLLRISWWLQTGNSKLAQKFIERGKELYPSGKKIGGRDWKWWLAELDKNDRNKVSERALTWGLLLR